MAECGTTTAKQTFGLDKRFGSEKDSASRQSVDQGGTSLGWGDRYTLGDGEDDGVLCVQLSNNCASPPPGSVIYAYDAADNLTKAGATQQVFNPADQICWTGSSNGPCGSPPAGATIYGYDARGNRTSVTPPSGAATSLSYDQANRLVSYGPSTTYAYNGDGLRMSKTTSGATTQFLWDVSGKLPVLAVDGTTDYIYGPENLPLEQINGSAVLWLHHDQLGSTRLITDSSGVGQAAYTFDAYGSMTAATGSVSTPFGFAGEYRDSESGLYYLRARLYDPVTGQFISRDPAVGKTLQPYAYAVNSPLNTADPTGLWGYHTDWALGYTEFLGSPEHVMNYFQNHPGSAFPFSLGNCTRIQLNERCDLRDDPFFQDAPVKVTFCDSTSFTFTAQKGHFDPVGSTVTFSVYEENGVDYLRQTAVWNIHNPAELAKAEVTRLAAIGTWSQQAQNLANAIDPGASADLFSGY